MSIQTEKAKDPTAFGGLASKVRDPMKIDIKEQLLHDFEQLSEEQKSLAVEYVKSLKSQSAPISDAVKQERLAKRLHALAQMDKVGAEITKHWKEDIGATELVTSMRR